MTIGNPKEKRIPRIDAKDVIKVISPKLSTLNILVKIGVKITGPKPWPTAPNR